MTCGGGAEPAGAAGDDFDFCVVFDALGEFGFVDACCGDVCEDDEGCFACAVDRDAFEFAQSVDCAVALFGAVCEK